MGASSAERIEIIHSDISHNEVSDMPSGGGGQAGGFSLGGGGPSVVEILYSTISNNRCNDKTDEWCVGGAYIIYCGDTPVSGLKVRNSTISSNKGKGLWLNSCYSTIENSTFYGNTGYGITVNDLTSQAYTVNARNTIFANNGIEDCNLLAGDWDFQEGHNLSSDDSCDLHPLFRDLINTDPELYPLGTYAPIAPAIALTHHPRWGSPVIDAGEGLISINDDQEGFARPMDGDRDNIGIHDMGAIEVLPCVFPYPYDLQVSNQPVTGNLTACNELSVGNRVDVGDPTIPIGPVTFSARTSVKMGDRFKVHSGTIFRVVMSRTAGSGY